MLDYFQDSKAYAFECNPNCLIECYSNIDKLDEIQKKRLFLVDKAASINNSKVSFYPFDLQKYNMGASSMLKIDFSLRNNDDPDYNRENPQKEIIVDGIRLDTFIDKNIDLLCVDLQGYELNAIRSLGNHLHKVKYIITECSIMTTYTGGATFNELNDYLTNYNFKYISSNKFGNIFPNLTLCGFSEFDVLFINQSAF